MFIDPSPLESAILAAANPVRLEMTVDAYRQLLIDLEEPRPDHIYVGMEVEDLFQLPVMIVSGPTKEFRVVEGCDET